MGIYKHFLKLILKSILKFPKVSNDLKRLEMLFVPLTPGNFLGK